MLSEIAILIEIFVGFILTLIVIAYCTLIKAIVVTEYKTKQIYKKISLLEDSK